MPECVELRTTFQMHRLTCYVLFKPTPSCFPDKPVAIRQSAARVKWLQDTCHSLNINDRIKLEKRRHMYDHILIDDANRMLFCDVPKTGSSFFKMLWLNYTRGIYEYNRVHDRGVLRKYNLRYLDTYNRTEVQIRLKSYFKFMVVRHPLVRILSAYRDKLENANPFYPAVLGRTIERQYGHVPAGKSKGRNVTFKQMVHYIIDHGPYDHHWTPISLLCNACEIEYDYVARLETSYLDYRYIFSKLKNVHGDNTGLPQSFRAYKGATDFDMVRKYYKTVPINYTNLLIEKYYMDFRLFGYTWNITSLSYGNRVNAYGKEY